MLDDTTAATTRSPAPPQTDASQPPPRTPRTPTNRRAGRNTALQDSTASAYAKDVRLFKADGGTVPCDPSALLSYIQARRTKLSPPTLYRRAMAVQHAHLVHGMPSPTDDPKVRVVLRALQLGYLPDKAGTQSSTAAGSTSARRRVPESAAPVTRKLLLQMLDAMGRNLLDRRDRALLLLGFMGAFKRSTLVAIRIGDLRTTPDALIVKRRRVEGDGRADADEPAAGQIAIPKTSGELCAVTAVLDWMQMAGLDMESKDGPLFRRFDRGGNPTSFALDSAYVNVILKFRLKTVGIDPAKFAAQSLRIGRLDEIGKGTL